MKRYAWIIVAACAIAGVVACGQQLVDLPFPSDDVDLGADLSVTEKGDMAHAGDGGNTDASTD